MKRTPLTFAALLATTLWVGVGCALQPPPPAPMGTAPPPPPTSALAAGNMVEPGYSGRGTIKAFNSGPNGETNGVILSDGTAVLFAPEIGEQFRSNIREGSRVTFTGMSRPGASNRLVVDAQTITANGQTFTVAAAAPPAFAGPNPPGAAGPPPPPEVPPAPQAGGRGRGGRGPGPAAADAPPPPPAGCSAPPPPPPPPGPGR